MPEACNIGSKQRFEDETNPGRDVTTSVMHAVASLPGFAIFMVIIFLPILRRSATFSYSFFAIFYLFLLCDFLIPSLRLFLFLLCDFFLFLTLRLFTYSFHATFYLFPALRLLLDYHFLLFADFLLTPWLRLFLIGR
jgi:hypothetical protein